MLWTLLLAVLLIVAALLYFYEEENPLDSLPGPPRWPIVGCVPHFIRMTPSEMFVRLRENARQHGDRYLVKIMRRRVLHVQNPDDVELILSHSKNIDKSKPYRFLIPWLGTGLLLSTGAKWHARRKILTPTFHFNIMKGFVSIFHEKTQDLITKLEASQGQEVELFPIISDFTLYTICETAMGTQLDRDKSSDTVAYKSAILNIGHLLMRRLLKVWLHSDFLFEHSNIGKQFKVVLHSVRSFADKVILERKRIRQEAKHEDKETNTKVTEARQDAKQEDKETNTKVTEARQDAKQEDKETNTKYTEVQKDTNTNDTKGQKRRMAMLDLLLEAESQGEIDLEGIREEVNTFMFEGHDTTATAITFGLLLLADHDDVQEKVYEECQRVLGEEKPTLSNLSEMKYLEAVLKETLRLYPSVSFIARTITEELTVAGNLRVKPGCEIAVNIYDLHHRPDLFPDPETFNPDRFLGDTRRHPYAFVPFSAGPRNCIGQRFAMLEMKCTLAEICRTFKLLPRYSGWRPALVADLILRSHDPIHVSFVKR